MLPFCMLNSFNHIKLVLVSLKNITDFYGYLLSNLLSSTLSEFLRNLE